MRSSPWLLSTLLFALPARADRKETPPQVYAAGAVVKLHAVEIELALPTGNEWSLSLAVEGSDAWDILRRDDGALTIELSRPHVANCEELAEALDAKKIKRHDNPALAPASFEPWAYEVSNAVYRVCTNTVRGPVTADVQGSVGATVVSSLLTEIGRMLGGRRGGSSLIAKGPPIALVGTALLAASGVRVDVPKGFSVHTLTASDGSKLDLLERFTPNASPVHLTLERVVGACPPLAGERVTSPPYVPPDFATEAYETPAKQGRTAAFCMKLGPDAIVARVTYVTADDARVIRGILAPAAAAKTGVGTSYSNSASEVDTVDDEFARPARIRGAFTADGLVVPAYHNDRRAFGGGGTLDLWGVTSAPRHRFGFGLELGLAGGGGAEKLAYFDAHGGIGPAIAIGRGSFFFPAIGGGLDLVGGRAFEERAAGHVYGGGRLSIGFDRLVSYTLSGSYHVRFAREGDATREWRAAALVAIGPVAWGFRSTYYVGDGLIGSFVLGLSL